MIINMHCTVAKHAYRAAGMGRAYYGGRVVHIMMCMRLYLSSLTNGISAHRAWFL